MTAPETPPPATAASSTRLLRSTVIALITAIVLLVVAVLPAEYGVDPTGVGRMLGLTEMGELKVALAREAAAEGSPDVAPAIAPAVTTADTAWRHTTAVTLLPNEGKEVKLAMATGQRATFEWVVQGGVVNYDTHGDSTDAPNSYHGYGKGTGSRGESGDLVAAFDGSHGWFWRNRSRKPVTVMLRTRGEYSDLKRMF